MSFEPSLIDRLGEASLEAKGLIRDLHAACKDGRAVLREIAAEREQVESMVRRSIEAECGDAMRAHMEEWGNVTKAAMDASVAKVGEQFDKLAKLYLKGRHNGPSLPELAERAARQAEARW